MPKVSKTRNGGTMTDAAFFNMLLKKLRDLSMWWKPGELYLRSVRRKNTSGVGKHQYEYPCESCGQWFRREEVEKDHKIPVGKVRTFKELGEATERMFIEIDGGWQCLCIPCHVYKSNIEKGQRQ